MSTIALAQYNNYYNRIVKKLDLFSQYLTGSNVRVLNDINFNPHDGVSTRLVIN